MKSSFTTKSFRVILLAAIVTLSLTMSVAPAHADVPDQDSCDTSTSLPFAWNDTSLDRPVVDSMTVDGETVPDPEAPADGKLGVSICPQTVDGRQVSLFVYKRSGSNFLSDLTGATTPISNGAIDDDTEITITITDFGSIASHMNDTLVYGIIDQWDLTDVDNTDTALTFTIKPAIRTNGNGQEFGGCTATPPMCNAQQSESETWGASMVFENVMNSTDNAYAGSYFALQHALGGFITSTFDSNANQNVLVAALGAPHLLSSGGVNIGSMQAFLTDASLESIGVDPETASASTIGVARTTDLDDKRDNESITFTRVEGGVIVSVSNIGFSSPQYSIQSGSTLTAASPTTTTTSPATSAGTGALPETGSRSSSLLVSVATMLLMAGMAVVLYARSRRRISFNR